MEIDIDPEKPPIGKALLVIATIFLAGYGAGNIVAKLMVGVGIAA